MFKISAFSTYLHTHFSNSALPLCYSSTRRRRKIRAQAWSLFARLFNIHGLQYSTLKQFLVSYTSTSSSLNFGMIIVNYFLSTPEFIQSLFKCVSRFCMHNVVGQTVQHRLLTILLVKKNLHRSYLVRYFCNLKSLPLVVRVGDVVKFGIAAKTYLPDSIL